MGTADTAQPRIKVHTREVRLAPVAADEVLQSIEPGDRVTIRNAQGREHSGRAQLVYDTHTVLDGGGAHGTPLIATASNIVRVTKRP